MTKQEMSRRLQSLGLYSLVASCVFIPFSSSLMGATSIIALACWIFSGKVLELPKMFISRPLVFLAMALFLLLIAGVFYSPAETGEALSSLKKYRELLLFVMALSFLADNGDKAVLAEKCFIGGSILLLSISYAMYFGVIPSERYGYSTVYHITHSLFMATLAFWALQKLIEGTGQRFFWLLIFIATSINLFYIAPGRTGMLISIALLLLTVFQRLSFKYSLFGVLLCASIVSGAFYTSHNFSTRVNEAVKEVQNYQPGVSRTSLGMRFDWWHNSLTLIKEKPIFGHGTGSFAISQKQLIKGTQTQPSDNPHNEYLLIAEQVGLVGLALYLAFLCGIFITSFGRPKPYNYLLQGVVVAMSCGCLMNSFLYDSHPGHFFAIMSAVLLSIPSPVQDEGKIS